MPGESGGVNYDVWPSKRVFTRRNRCSSSYLRASVAACAHVVITRGQHMSYLVDQARDDMQRAKREVERARLAYNEKAKTFNEAKARYDRLAARQFEIELELARERQAAQERGDHGLAALLTTQPLRLR